MSATRVCPRCWLALGHRATCPEHGLRGIDDRTGDVIAGRYQLTRVLALGSQHTTVWDAFDLRRPRAAAVKLCPPTNPVEFERTIHGTWVGSLVEHSHVAGVYEYGETDDGQFYCVMERLRGRSIQRILDDGSFRLLDGIKVADQVLVGLDRVHAEGIVHLDIKPANVFVSATAREGGWRAVILDFGIARFIADVGAEAAVEADDDKKIVGTPEYMAPEQIVGGRLDGRADLYAFGVLLFRMLTGSLPFTGASRHDLYRAHISEVPPTLADAAPDGDFPPLLEDLVARLLAKSPGDRPETANDTRAALGQVRRALNAARKTVVTRRLAYPVGPSDASPREPGSEKRTSLQG